MVLLEECPSRHLDHLEGATGVTEDKPFLASLNIGTVRNEHKRERKAGAIGNPECRSVGYF